MKKRVVSLLLMLVLLVSAAVPALGAGTMQQGSMYVNTANGKALRFRSSKSTSANNVLTEIPYGTKVYVLNWDGTWARVRYNSAVGYVVQKHLSIARPEPFETVVAQRAQAAAVRQAERELKAANARLDRSKLRAVVEYDVTVRVGVTEMTVTAYQKADLTSASVAHYEDGARLTVQAQNRSWAKIYDGAADLTGYMLLEDLEMDLIEEEILEDDVFPSSPPNQPAAPDAESQTEFSSEGEPMPESEQNLSPAEATPVPENYYDDLYLDEEGDG